MSRFSDLFSHSDIPQEEIKPVVEEQAPAPEPVKLEKPAPLKAASKPTLRRSK